MTLAGAVVDLDGTVYRDGEAIDGASDGIDRLRAAGRDVLFVSNSPVHSPESYVDRLATIGVETSPEQVLSSGVVTAEFLVDEHPDDTVFLIGDDGLGEQLRVAGITCSEDPAEADVLVASYTTAFDYDDMVDALRILERPVPFYGTDPDRTFPGADGKPLPGSGSIVRAIAGTVGRDPDRIFGKPSALMVDAVGQRLAGPTESSLVIGDRLGTDIALGERAGMTTVLVRTGIDDGPDPDGDISPDYVIDSLGDIETVLADL
ncbi:HAD-IIA family hydrolase [Halorhabdus sp. CUG00001]|uniref:HAD-IIA family hydrolase n=1 Tax=Halorhabdus sp. CUG00001 TaxID=2600297 RepID=UPI00131D7538|nr:HAD-IIA family hydrolase [Halorhabdus sp. CUG00001]